MTTHIYPEFEKMLSRGERESLLKQRGHVFWFYGLSGSGKSTITRALQRRLYEQGLVTEILDGDNIRTGLNKDLGFTDAERLENIRRIAEVAKLFAQAGIIVLTAFITPNNELRHMAKEIIGADDYTSVYVKASFETCAERDPKGLYKKVSAGEVKHFTGKDSGFEEPDDVNICLDTEQLSVKQALEVLMPQVLGIAK